MMNITPTQRSITEYQLILSEQDAQACLTDPYSFVEQLATQLRAAGVANGNHKAHPKPGKQQQMTINPRRAAQKIRGGYTHSKRPTVECTICHRQIAAFMFSRHMTTKHPNSAAIAE